MSSSPNWSLSFLSLDDLSSLNLSFLIHKTGPLALMLFGSVGRLLRDSVPGPSGSSSKEEDRKIEPLLIPKV